MNKLEFAKNSLESKIADTEKEIEGYEKEIRNYASCSSRFDMITFLPSICKRLEDAMNKLSQLNEQKQMLEFISKED